MDFAPKWESWAMLQQLWDEEVHVIESDNDEEVELVKLRQCKRTEKARQALANARAARKEAALQARVEGQLIDDRAGWLQSNYCTRKVYNLSMTGEIDRKKIQKERGRCVYSLLRILVQAIQSMFQPNHAARHQLCCGRWHKCSNGRTNWAEPNLYYLWCCAVLACSHTCDWFTRWGLDIHQYSDSCACPVSRKDCWHSWSHDCFFDCLRARNWEDDAKHWPWIYPFTRFCLSYRNCCGRRAESQWCSLAFGAAIAQATQIGRGWWCMQSHFSDASKVHGSPNQPHSQTLCLGSAALLVHLGAAWTYVWASFIPEGHRCFTFEGLARVISSCLAGSWLYFIFFFGGVLFWCQAWLCDMWNGHGPWSNSQ